MLARCSVRPRFTGFRSQSEKLPSGRPAMPWVPVNLSCELISEGWRNRRPGSMFFLRPRRSRDFRRISEKEQIMGLFDFVKEAGRKLCIGSDAPTPDDLRAEVTKLGLDAGDLAVDVQGDIVK